MKQRHILLCLYAIPLISNPQDMRLHTDLMSHARNKGRAYGVEEEAFLGSVMGMGVHNEHYKYLENIESNLSNVKKLLWCYRCVVGGIAAFSSSLVIVNGLCDDETIINPFVPVAIFTLSILAGDCLFSSCKNIDNCS